MDNRPIDQDVPVWRETPLDHWSTDIDPVIMSGDEWVDNTSDPGTERMQEAVARNAIGERFMHPTHDVTFGLLDDTFLDTD